LNQSIRTNIPPGAYSIQEALSNGIRYDLEIREINLNEATRAAVKAINPIIKLANSWLATPIRRRSTLGRIPGIRSSKPRLELHMLNECRTSGRLTKHMAMLGQTMLAVAYKLEGRKITLSDAVGIMAQDNREIQGVVNYYEERIRDGGSGLNEESLQYLTRELAIVTQRIQNAEGMRQHIKDDQTSSDEPIAAIILPAGSKSLASTTWYDYRAWTTAGSHLHFDARMATVRNVVWLSDAIVELGLQGHSAKYFASPLNGVAEGLKEDQVEIGDIAVLAGRYIILAVPNDDDSSNGLILTNFLKITSVEEPVQRLRNRNRQPAREANGTITVDPMAASQILFL
jgi:hypothetical protein